MTVNTAIGCGKQPILSPGQSCLVTLNYKVPTVTKKTLVQQGPFVCTAGDLIHCSQPTQKNQFNMAIDFKPLPNIITEGSQSLLIGNSSGNLNQWFKISQAETNNGIGYGNGRWIIVSSVNQKNATNVVTSTDGKTWNVLNLGGSDLLNGVYYATELKQWLLYGVNGVMYHSVDGINFTRIKLNTGNDVDQVFYSLTSVNNPGHWIALSNDTNNYGGGGLFTSSNGLSWVQ
ncbi:MAG: hypothetical protein PSV35_09540, partial [bacterium]|nr:hypothetical protein [bacterium]